MDKINLHRIPSQPFIHNQTTRKPAETAKNSFQSHLQKASDTLEALKVSKHARERLAERNITISEMEWTNISAKVDEAKAKGVRESLVLLDQAALIVSAKNGTVITAMDRAEAKSQIFTNIDGTILL